MNSLSLPPWLHRNITRIAACLIAVFLFFEARVPDISAAEAMHLATRFHFVAHAFPVVGASTASAEVPAAISMAS